MLALVLRPPSDRCPSVPEPARLSACRGTADPTAFIGGTLSLDAARRPEFSGAITAANNKVRIGKLNADASCGPSTSHGPDPRPMRRAMSYSDAGSGN